MTRALIVESDGETRALLGRALAEKGYELTDACTAAEALDALRGARFDVIVSALPLPDGSGHDVTRAARDLLPDVATVIIADNGDFETASRLLRNGIDGYLVKPLNEQQVAVTVAGAAQRRIERGIARTRGEELRALVEAQTSAASDDPVFGALLLRRLARAARFRDEETAAHMQRMSSYCAALARKLGFAETDAERLRSAALLHDIGKVGVPDDVLRKPDRLTREERKVMELHTEFGHEILTGSGNELVELAATIALSHHERFDGKGYPRGLAGEEIPLPGRIAAVADVFDAITNDRVYRRARSTDEALEVLAEGRGSQFDPAVVDAFFDAIDEIADIKARHPDSATDGDESAVAGEPATPPTRVLIVEDHEAVARGLELLLRREGMEISGTAFNLAGARALLERRRPDVVILDVDLDGASGLELIEDADRAGARILLYTGRADPELLGVAADTAALGVATKAGPPVELIQAVRAVAAGQEYHDPRLIPLGGRPAEERKLRLTPREREIVTLLAQGLQGQEIAETLFLSPETVRTHVRNAMERVGATTRAHLIAVTLANGEIEVE